MDVMGEAEFRALLRAQVDVMVNAFACDVTRIGSIQCSSAVNALRFTFMGLNDNEGHSLSHSGDSNELLQGQWDQMLTWYSEQQAYLLERLASVSEGAGTLLDNTLLLFVNEISRGNTHSHEDMPFILAGGAGGALNAGRYLRYDNENHLRLLQSVLELMDVDSSDFGLREFPLSRSTARHTLIVYLNPGAPPGRRESIYLNRLPAIAAGPPDVALASSLRRRVLCDRWMVNEEVHILL